MIHGLDEVKISSALVYSSEATARAGTALDMSGYQGVLVVCRIADCASAQVLKIQTDDNSSFSSASVLDGSGQTLAKATHDNDIFVWDIKNPPERYLRIYAATAAGTANGTSAEYIQYGADSMPQTSAAANAIMVETFRWTGTGTA